MISEKYSTDVYIADFTDYNNRPDTPDVGYKGVIVGLEENGIIPSFVFTDANAYSFVVVNNEKNSALFKRKDGSKLPQCECIIYAERNDNRKAWMLFLELKYCEAKNRYVRMLEGIGQLKATIKHVMDGVRLFDRNQFKPYLVISTPGVEPLDPFDAFYFDHDFMLTVIEETGAIIKAANKAHIMTPALINLEK